MALDPDRLQKPFKKLSKLLRKFPKQPSPEQVHEVRTRTRRTEAALHALSLDRKRMGKQALKAVARVRKRAGKVRDMDVLTAFASTLDDSSDNDCFIQLLEQLGHERFKRAQKLHKVVDQQRRAATRSLRRCAGFIKHGFEENKSWPVHSAASALQLSAEVASWPKLTGNNLHAFRLKVKELRYVFQLSGEHGPLFDELDHVKDAIGEWHDWMELADFATEVLSHSGRCYLQDQIRAETNRHFEKAVALAAAMRQEYFGQPQSSGSKKRRSAGLVTIKPEVLKASASLVA